MAEWSKAPDSSSGSRERAWVQIPLLTMFLRDLIPMVLEIKKSYLKEFF